jgi:hypothetical protein
MCHLIRHKLYEKLNNTGQFICVPEVFVRMGSIFCFSISIIDVTYHDHLVIVADDIIYSNRRKILQYITRLQEYHFPRMLFLTFCADAV